jgi:hypothetical protein
LDGAAFLARHASETVVKSWLFEEPMLQRMRFAAMQNRWYLRQSATQSCQHWPLLWHSQTG